MSNTKKFAERELEILSKSATDPNNRPIIEEFIPEIIALCDKFGHSGQSGGSAPYTAKALAQAIEKLCLQKPIGPITGIDDEWVDVSGYGDNHGKNDIKYQNSRCSTLFKSVNGRVWYLDAINWKDEKGACWSGLAYLANGDKINSRQFLKSFPFEPKTFYVDITSEETKPDDWKFYVKDEKQLEEVFNYYAMPVPRREVIFEKTDKTI